MLELTEKALLDSPPACAQRISSNNGRLGVMFRSRAEKREALRATPLEPERVAVIARMFPYFSKLSEADQHELLGHVQVFLAEKSFEGCGGLELTDDIKLTIAAQACVLLLHRDTDYYPKLDAILVYPHAYIAGHTARDGALVVDRDDVRLGESHQRGLVVLSWDAVRGGAAAANDGHNVVFHEFAHQLDQEDGVADGAPLLPRRSSYAPWAKILGAELEALKDDAREDRRTVIDKYGAKNPSEFFAVITEAFFEKPRALATRHPALYDELVEFYEQDPLARLGEPRPAPHPRVDVRPDAEPKIATRRITYCDMSNDARAAALVGVGNDLREKVRALGCMHCGYLGTLHEVGNKALLAFVADVFRCPDEHVVAALFSFGGYGDGLAFWTLLENGTAIETETTAVRPLSMALRTMIGHHPREHFFIASLAVSPKALYEAHTHRVDEIARRERTLPLSKDPFLTYVAVRRRSADMMIIGAEKLKRLYGVVRPAVFVFAVVAIFGVAALVAPPGAIGTHLGLVLIAILATSAILTELTAGPLARVLSWRQFRSAPVSPAVLFEHKTDASSVNRLVAALKEDT
jgi:MtfA peptidase